LKNEQEKMAIGTRRRAMELKVACPLQVELNTMSTVIPLKCENGLKGRIESKGRGKRPDEA
jgi:hypothetical protein